MKPIKEVKRHKNKPDESFLCSALLSSAEYTVLWYRAPRPGTVEDILLPAGTYTVAHYWQQRGYVLWRMFYPCGSLAGSLFHICSQVTLMPSEVRYLDLILDIWVSPSKIVRVLDEDELAVCREQGLISDPEQRWIETQKCTILFNHTRIIQETLQIEGHIDIIQGALMQ